MLGGIHLTLSECGALLSLTAPLCDRDWAFLARWYLADGLQGHAVGIPPPPGRLWMNQHGLIQRADGSYPAPSEPGLFDEWDAHEEQRAQFGHLPFFHPGYQHLMDPDDLNPPSDSDGMESPYEGDEQLRGSDLSGYPAPQAASLSRDGVVAAPVLDVSGAESDSSEDLEALTALADAYSDGVARELLSTVPRRPDETDYELLLRSGFCHDSLDGISPGWIDSGEMGHASTYQGGRVFVFPSRAFRTEVAWRRLVRRAYRRNGGPALALRLEARQAARALGRAQAEQAAPTVVRLREEEARRLAATVARASEVWAAVMRRMDQAAQDAVAADHAASTATAGEEASGSEGRGRGRRRRRGRGRGGGAGGGRREAP